MILISISLRCCFPKMPIAQVYYIHDRLKEKGQTRHIDQMPLYQNPFLAGTFERENSQPLFFDQVSRKPFNLSLSLLLLCSLLLPSSLTRSSTIAQKISALLPQQSPARKKGRSGPSTSSRTRSHSRSLVHENTGRYRQATSIAASQHIICIQVPPPTAIGSIQTQTIKANERWSFCRHQKIASDALLGHSPYSLPFFSARKKAHHLTHAPESPHPTLPTPRSPDVQTTGIPFPGQ